MIIFGYTTINYSSKRPKGIRCHQCGHEGQTFVLKFLHYCFIWFIPIFPYRIWTEFECVRCNFSSTKNSLSPDVRSLYRPFQSKQIPPIWTFAGSLGLLLIPVVLWLSSLQEKREMLIKLEHLENNQKFDYRTENGTYSIFKLLRMDGDRISVAYNQFETTSEEGLVNIDYPHQYSKDTTVMTMSELKTWVETGKVVFIYR